VCFVALGNKMIASQKTGLQLSYYGAVSASPSIEESFPQESCHKADVPQVVDDWSCVKQTFSGELG
jgi:hypothetical protein